jgi:ferredoxin
VRAGQPRLYASPAVAHLTLKSAYGRLSERLNRVPQGAPASELLFKILRMLFSEREAGLVALLPIRPFTARKAAEAWKLPLAETERILEELSSRALLVDLEERGKQLYVLPPPMAGFFEFSMMRVRDDIDQKALSELFYQYITVEEDFMRALFVGGETQLGRTFVHEPALRPDDALHVLDYERATYVIDDATAIGVGMCYCRHKMQHHGTACAAPMNICMTFNTTAASLTKHGHARRIERSEAHELLHQAYEANLVQFGENVRRRPAFICNCCGCCCEAMKAARRFAVFHPIHTTNFLPQLESSTCNGCGKCVNACPVEAMTLVSANDPARQRARKAKVNEDVCLGCGICVRNCNRGSLTLRSRPERVITPVDGVHRAVLMAVERGKLQNLIFDNQVLWSHRALAAVLGAILRLPPIKQLLAIQQVKSRYVEVLIGRQH